MDPRFDLTVGTKAAALAFNGGAFNVAGFVNSGDRAGLKDTAWSIGGNLTTGIFRVNTGYFDYKAEQGSRGDRKDKAWTVSGKLAPPGKMDYELGYQQMRLDLISTWKSSSRNDEVVRSDDACTVGGSLTVSSWLSRSRNQR